MFERYLTDALTTHFGHVVENLDSDKVRLSAWNGELVLKDLSLRSNALDSFMGECPVEIAYGRVGNLEMRIPWGLFGSQLRWRKDKQQKSSQAACSVILTDINIVITPRRHEAATSDVKEEKPTSLEEQRIQKEKHVQALLDADLLKRVTESSSSSSSRWSWVQDLLSNMLSSLSVTVRNIHIRYEDPGTSMGFVWRSDTLEPERRYRPAFSIGITLQQFSIQTDTDTDEEGDGFNKQNNDIDVRRKVVAAKELAVYWDSNCELLSVTAIGEDAHFETSFSKWHDENRDDPSNNTTIRKSQHSYILDPVSPCVKIALVPKSSEAAMLGTTNSAEPDNNSTDSPSTHQHTPIAVPSSIRLDLPPCKFTLSRNTLEDTAYIRRSLSAWKQSTKGLLSETSLRRLTKLRPLKPPSEDPRKWWYYAFEATLALERVNKQGRDLENIDYYKKRRRGWLGLVDAVVRRKRYIDMYKQFLSLSDRSKLEESHETLLEMEDNLLPEEIVAFRAALYDWMIEEDFAYNVARTSQTISPRARQTDDRRQPQNIIFDLSVDQRILIVEETMLALEREKSNALERDHDGSLSPPKQTQHLVNEKSSELLIWKASVICRELSLQVNDGAHSRRRDATASKNEIVPVIRISAAWIQDQAWYEDGSWDMDCSLASFAVRDLTSSTSNRAKPRKYFQNLIGPKHGNSDDFVLINGIRFERSISITVRKKLNWNIAQKKGLDAFPDRGSTTTSQIRVLPMEVVYSTLPVEALSRVLATIKTPELVDDYHRMAAAAHRWQERQKTKFLRALAHKYKKIIIDVDVGAPELLIPEDINRRDTPMLAVNLGRLQMFNDSSKMISKDFDDQWRVALSDIQARSTTASRYFARIKTNHPGPESTQSQKTDTSSTLQLVEPFSLDFTISTKIASDDSPDSRQLTRVHISATLPRLAFNITSSAVRLTSRLQMQWKLRKKETENRAIGFDHLPAGQKAVPDTPFGKMNLKETTKHGVLDAADKTSRSSRLIHFDFSAPTVTLRLENDVDCIPGEEDYGTMASTALVDLAFQGIHGEVTQDVSINGESTLTFSARLHSMGAIDLYQNAGNDFALLMSSIPQHLVHQKFSGGEVLSWHDFHAKNVTQLDFEAAGKNDLVTIEYKSQTLAKTHESVIENHSLPVNKLSVWFHELYVEWNPETLAAVQRALRLPENSGPTKYDNESEADGSNDEFFDALEEEYFDVGSDDSAIHSLSEISSSSINNQNGVLHHDIPSRSSLLPMNLNLGQNQFLLYNSTMDSSREQPLQPDNSSMSTNSKSPFHVIFKLSKLRVCFNKETRHRKVIVAEMDGTSVSYLSNPDGGSKTSMSIGNLVFIDPSKDRNTTLYGQILGLKSSTNHPKNRDRPSSLLEMEILINPKTREFNDIAVEMNNHNVAGVVIDRGQGIMTGCNNFVHARFSPMRFVFLEQLWFEVIDYFFEGVIGAEVWGGTRPTSNERADSLLVDQDQIPRTTEAGYLHGSDADGVSFTRFDISLDTPEILFPVTYRSPHFIRLQLSNVAVKNHYNSSVVPDLRMLPTNGFRMQWFNNCEIKLEELRLLSWCGRELGKNPVFAKVKLRWPTGPLATSIVPKWNVDCNFDSLSVALRQSDYGLLQNIISFNIGEPSRHLDEWEALQSLSPDRLERFNKKLAVHFGYDKKDVAPTTYDLTVSIPSVSFDFVDIDRGPDLPLAVARCVDFVWKMKKGADLVNTQKATCDVDLVTPGENSKFEKLLSLAKYDENISSEHEDFEDHDVGIPELTYTSTSRPSGDNVKTLEIIDACIYMVVPAWRRFVGFFQGLPAPAIFSEDEIKASIQVGDRWYRMGGEDIAAEAINSSTKIQQALDWIRALDTNGDSPESSEKIREQQPRASPTFQLKISLTRPRIILSSLPLDGNTQHLILRMHHLEFLHTNNRTTSQISRAFFLHEVELYTLSNKKVKRDFRKRENSLIHPWSVIGLINKCNGEHIGNCKTHSITVSGDVLEARAAYSDMMIALDVCLSVAQSARERDVAPTNSALSRTNSSISVSDSSHASVVDTDLSDGNAKDSFCVVPEKMLYCVECDGFELKVADDSGRHFAGEQDLVVLKLGKVLFSREDILQDKSSMNLRLNSLDLFDCLQTTSSPFRLAASSRSGAMGLQRYQSKDSPIQKIPIMKDQPTLHRKMAWNEFRVKEASSFGFSASPLLLERTTAASAECLSRDSTNSTKLPSAAELIEIKCFYSGKGLQEYYVKLRWFAVQWNPSTVIAIQRFLGRLRKESRMNMATHELNQQGNDVTITVSGDSHDDISMPATDSSIREESVCIRGTFEIDSLTVCLNKEHQRRRLIELTFSGSQVHVDSSETGLSIEGRLGNFYAWDSDDYILRNADEAPIVSTNRDVLKVMKGQLDDEKTEGDVPFLEIKYKTFKNDYTSRMEETFLPGWIRRRISQLGGIDDFLKVEVSGFQFTYLRERTEEILDYLSNGLPGKGMGATSRAAKGFISKRILTKSFLDLHVRSPQILVPQHESLSDGMRLELGDVRIHSWFEETNDKRQKERLKHADVQKEWYRVLSLDINGFRGKCAKNAESSGVLSLSSMTEPIDLKIVLRKPTMLGREMSIRGTLSFVEVTLQYTDYLVLRAIARDNIGRKIDTARWDNVEKAYWLEEELANNNSQKSGMNGIGVSSEHAENDGRNHVAYSSNARFIRYGKNRKSRSRASSNGTLAPSFSMASSTDAAEKDENSLDLNFELGGLALTFRRDDAVEGMHERDPLTEAFYYNVMLLRVQLVEVSLKTKSKGDMSFHLSLFRIGLFDLGDRGRLIRNNYYACLPPEQFSGLQSKRKTQRRSCPFQILAEGYTPDDSLKSNNEGFKDGPQFVVTVDRCPASSAGAIGSIEDHDLPSDSKVILARVVINYLTINAMIRPFQEIAAFLSCEWPSTYGKPCIQRTSEPEDVPVTDSPSNQKETTSEKEFGRGFQVKVIAHYPRIFFLADECDAHTRALVLRGLAVVNLSNIESTVPGNSKRVTAVDAQLVSMESYINPDVSDALRFTKRHQDTIGASLLASFPIPDEESPLEPDLGDSLGIALIQPVTTGLEFCEIKRNLFPTKRSLFVNIEPVSTMLSFEDLQLIEAVLNRWSYKKSKGKSSNLLASREQSLYRYNVTFRSDRLGLGLRTEGENTVVSSIQISDEHIGMMKVGDILLTIDGEDYSRRSLSEIVKCLAKQRRPTTIEFGRIPNDAGPGINTRHASKQNTINGSANSAKESNEHEAYHSDGFVESYSVKFRTGMIHGLEFEMSVCGRFPVVTKVLPAFFEATASSAIDETNAEQIETTFEEPVEVRVPAPGSIIVGFNDFEVNELGFREVWNTLKMFTPEGIDDSSDCHVDGFVSLGAFYTLHFKEIDSTLWGSIDSLDISFSGIDVSFIDDLNGRDMPLFRGNFSEVQAHAERGLGVPVRIVDVDPPSFLRLASSSQGPHRSSKGYSGDEILELRSESVLTFNGIARCSVDYFHPRIAYWEPLLESSQLYLHCEKQAPSAGSGRPGQLALEVSDRLLYEQNFRGHNLPSHLSAPQMVMCNVTDAAADVLGKTLSQWKEWRRSVMDEKDIDLEEDPVPASPQNHSDFPGSPTSLKVSTSDTFDDLRIVHGISTSPSVASEGEDKIRTSQQMAAQKAAQAALVFAQKRGAETSKKGESAKPFIFRNRTGVSIAFVQKEQSIGERSSRRGESVRVRRRVSLVGEYWGLQDYKPSDITELADQEEAKFSMELLSDHGSAEKDPDDLQGASNKIRNYEGRFPSLTVAIQAVAGVNVAPLEDLEVFKVGSVVRYLTVRKDSDTFVTHSGHIQYSIPVVWKVEIDDNRRILTLSTAVRVVSTGFNAPIEVGVTHGLGINHTVSADYRDEESVKPIGVSRPGSPFYLPLWLSLRLQCADVYVRPFLEGSRSFKWGESSVLHFGQSLDEDGMSGALGLHGTDVKKWTWEESNLELGYIRCDPPENSHLPIWFSVFGSSSKSKGKIRLGRFHEDLKKDATLTSLDFDEEFNEVISVTVDSGLTMRNMLPMSIDWEVSHYKRTDSPLSSTTVDGSSVRKRAESLRSLPTAFTNSKSFANQQSLLGSGDCTEVYACDYESCHLQARFKEPYRKQWSAWVTLAFEEVEFVSEGKGAEGQDTSLGMLPTARQVNVQITNDVFGVPLTLGVRMIPKMTHPTIDDPTRGRAYGLEVILYAELWIRNITDLPLNFGCPSHQFHDAEHELGDGESVARFTAESALMEIANLLEVGDKGTGLSNKAAMEVAESGRLKSLPNQECQQLVEEVFEYIEIESSTVKRRWWASESYDSYRGRIVDAVEPSGSAAPWKWHDERWSVDCSGQAKASFGGWESCRNLLAGAGSFSGHRIFNPSHSIRRRRFFRRRSGHFSASRHINKSSSGIDNKSRVPGSLLGGLQAFHQPITDSFTREKYKAMKKRKLKKRGKDRDKDKREEDGSLKIAIKCGDGRWSVPATIPSSGTNHGVIRVLASRWLTLTKKNMPSRNTSGEFTFVSEDNTLFSDDNLPCPVSYRSASLDPQLFELCYTVSDAEGEWGEFSRVMTVSPRFLVRNDSERFTIAVKQAGVSEANALKLSPGEVQPFYWADFRLPGLASVTPMINDNAGENMYRWSGGFDLCNLGMVPIRLRPNSQETGESPLIRSIRATMEVRPGTGGTGINVSFKEEDPSGEGSLFRIENLSTFPVWVAQDGVLANPLAVSTTQTPPKPKDIHGIAFAKHHESFAQTESISGSDGDLFRPLEKSTYALDVPYRQGKYAHRKEATMSELLRLRVALAPLGSRDGIETVKVIGLTKVGDSIRLNPSRLVGPLSMSTRSSLQRIRILAIVTTDGPTRVLKFCLMETPAPDVFSNPFGDVAYMASGKINADPQPSRSNQKDYMEDIRQAGLATLAISKSETIPSEEDAKRSAMAINPDTTVKTVTPSKARENEDTRTEGSPANQIYSFRAQFSGFLFSFVDSIPSEIAVVSLKNFNALARWDSFRTSDASLIVSIGWLQVDNHVPSAPFKVVVRPDIRRLSSAFEKESSSSEVATNEDVPLLVVALAFAPKHKSGIMCLRSVTVAPRNLVIAVDLAFLVRLQRFFLGIAAYFNNKLSGELVGDRAGMSMLSTDQKRRIPFPCFDSREKEMERAAVFSSENQKVYFHGLTILPCNITLSVAPARALTSTQASLEGKEAAAIHQAVRKGDVLLGNSTALLGVRVGRRNATPLAVVRGVLKSIVVDALLRLDGASLNFAGLSLRNHISTGPQLTTFILAHYVSSLRQNVPALLGSLAAFGNPLGLIRGLGDGMSDFVSEPVKGLKKSVKELDPSFLVDGVARGTESLARHTVGGFADSASLLTETFSKNMAVLTLDRRYAQKRDRGTSLRLHSDTDVTLAGGVESGFIKLVQGFRDGVTGVVKAPIRGAEKSGIEGFAKGVGKGLLGLLVKPMIGISDAATEVMIGVKRTVEDTHAQEQNLALTSNQFRPRRPMYGRDKVLRPYQFEDAAAATLMLRTRCAGENYLGHLDLGDRVALLSVRRMVLIGANGQEMFALKYDHVSSMELRQIPLADGSDGWGIIILLNTPRRNGSDVEVISCKKKEEARKLYAQIKRGTNLVANESA